MGPGMNNLAATLPIFLQNQCLSLKYLSYLSTRNLQLLSKGSEAYALMEVMVSFAFQFVFASVLVLQLSEPEVHSLILQTSIAKGSGSGVCFLFTRSISD
jgi:hypothetical protein